MPVRFLCTHCRQPLSIARRKIGTTINCPRCFIPVRVPDQADEDDAVANKRDGDAMVVFEDVDALLQQPVRGQPWQSAPPPPLPTIAPASVATVATKPKAEVPAPASMPTAHSVPPPLTAAQPPSLPVATAPAPTSPYAASPYGTPTAAPRADQPAATPGMRNQPGPRSATAPRSLVHPELVMSYLFLHRSAIYLQGVVLLVVAGGAFWAGWVSGHQDWLRSNPNDPAVRSANHATVVVTGSVAYETTTGRQADKGAAVILLPLGTDRKKLQFPGWKPPVEGGVLPERVTEEIRNAHGDITLVKDSGSFEIVVPRAGEYQMLVISSHGRRPQGQLVNKSHLEEMVEWFESPSSLIGWSLYLWQPQRIDDPPASIELFFPMSP
jgi:hypothetical protein